MNTKNKMSYDSACELLQAWRMDVRIIPDQPLLFIVYHVLNAESVCNATCMWQQRYCVQQEIYLNKSVHLVKWRWKTIDSNAMQCKSKITRMLKLVLSSTSALLTKLATKQQFWENMTCRQRFCFVHIIMYYFEKERIHLKIKILYKYFTHLNAIAAVQHALRTFTMMRTERAGGGGGGGGRRVRFA